MDSITEVVEENYLGGGGSGAGPIPQIVTIVNPRKVSPRKLAELLVEEGLITFDEKLPNGSPISRKGNVTGMAGETR